MGRSRDADLLADAVIENVDDGFTPKRNPSKSNQLRPVARQRGKSSRLSTGIMRILPEEDAPRSAWRRIAAPSNTSGNR